MALTPHDLVEQARARRQAQSRHSYHTTDAARPSGSPAAPSLRSAESWIEVPSRDSSTSLSSAGDEIITHGLRVGNSEPQRRRRPAHPRRPLHLSLQNNRSTSATGSSQDEYTESESESDQVMTSSNEAISTGDSSEAHSRTPSDAAADDEDDEENATALGMGTRVRDETCFTPQPNAFSHPPASQIGATGSYFPTTRPPASRTASRRASGPQPSHSLYNAISPNHQPDHDAALRASLNTLLSCAAAARGLPKPSTSTSPDSKEWKPSPPAPKPRQKPNPARVDPSTLRIIQGPPKSNTSRPRQPSASPSRSSISEKGKRKASRSSSKDRRSTKRLRSVGADQAISPTLLTWVVSAGVLVLVSALSFSAGVSVGREAERLQLGVGDGLEGKRRSGLGLRRRLLSAGVRAVAA